MSTRRWGIRTGWRYFNMFIDEPGQLNLPAQQWFEVSLLLAGWRLPVFRWGREWLNGRPAHPRAELVR